MNLFTSKFVFFSFHLSTMVYGQTPKRPKVFTYSVGLVLTNLRIRTHSAKIWKQTICRICSAHHTLTCIHVGLKNEDFPDKTITEIPVGHLKCQSQHIFH